jgi:putative multiple sugar transport system substrate-binding protein
VEVLFSQGDSAKEKANVELLNTKGVKIIVICPQDASAAAAAADEARAAGVKVIFYDRLIRDSASLDYYVTFDSVAIEAAWGTYLVSKASGSGNDLIMMNAMIKVKKRAARIVGCSYAALTAMLPGA